MGTMNPLVVVTASFYGKGKENQRPATRPLRGVPAAPPFEGVQYKLFTNNPEKAKGKGWEIILVEQEKDLRLKAREIKSNIHTFFPDASEWLWVDSNMKIVENPHALVSKYLKTHHLVAMPHHCRSNYWQEVNEICAQPHLVSLGQGPPAREAGKRYRNEGHMPIGLYETGCLLRRNCKDVVEFNKTWWNEIKHRSIRDQVSFTYAAWKTGLAINSFPGSNKERNKAPPTFKYLPVWKEIVRAW